MGGAAEPPSAFAPGFGFGGEGGTGTRHRDILQRTEVTGGKAGGGCAGLSWAAAGRRCVAESF